MKLYYDTTILDVESWYIEMEDNFLDGLPIDQWQYSRCLMVEDAKPVPFRVQREGPHFEYNPTIFMAPVVSLRVADLLQRIAPAEIQRIPVIINGIQGEWELINILSSVDCIDHKASLIRYYPIIHPTRSGKPRGVIRLVLDCTRIGAHQIFRLKDWNVAIIVSSEVKKAFEEIGIEGIGYIPVCKYPQENGLGAS